MAMGLKLMRAIATDVDPMSTMPDAWKTTFQAFINPRDAAEVSGPVCPSVQTQPQHNQPGRCET